MSSDSEDDCYGNIAQKLNSIKSKYTEDKIKTTNILGDSSTNAVSSISSQNAEKPVVIDLVNASTGPTGDCNSTFNSLDGDDNILDQIIASNAKKKGRKSKTIISDISTSNILPERASRRKRGRPSTTDLTTTNVSQNISINNTNTTAKTPNLTVNDSVLSDSSVSAVNSTRGRRGAKRGRRSRGAVATSPRTAQPPVTSTSVTAPSKTSTNTTVNSPSAGSKTNTTLNTTLNSTRGSGRCRRGRGTTPRRPRQRRRNYGWFSSRRNDPFNPFTSEDDDIAANSSVAALLNAIASAGRPPNANTSSYPTYSVGNTYEYPDESHGQQLFQNKPAPSKDVEIIENDEDTEIDNEELSVKVYWQNLEYVKFNIRKYQKLSQIFDHFAQRENVTHDKLFFTYNDKILKSTDSPDSIGYSIAKFIDGGIIKQNVSQLVKDTGKLNIILLTISS